jgi:hypothetical protein
MPFFGHLQLEGTVGTGASETIVGSFSFCYGAANKYNLAK